MTLRHISLRASADLDGFRQAARKLVAEGVAPDEVAWTADDTPLPLPWEARPPRPWGEVETAVAVRVRGETCPERASFPAGELCPAPDRPSPVSFADTFSPWEKVDASAPPLLLPRSVRECITEAVPHRDPERYALLYALIWRVLRGERGLPEVASDPLVHRLNRMRRAVRRDIHKMHAFVRFRRTNESGAERFVAWFEPDHFILEAAAPFFVERFRALAWSILTPVGSAHWDRERLVFGPPARPEDAPRDDPFEAGWCD